MAKRGLVLAAGYATSLTGSILSLAMYARVLGPTDYGRLAVYLALVEAIQGVLFQWHRLAVVRFWARTGQHDHDAYLATYHRTWLAIAGVAVIAGGLFVAVHAEPKAEWSAMIVMAIAKSAALYAQELARVAGSTLRYTAGQLLLSAGSGVAGVIAYLHTQSIALTLLAAAAVFLAATLTSGWPTMRPSGSVSPRRADPHSDLRTDLRDMIGYGLPLIPVFVATTALTRLDRPILAHFEPSNVVGTYAAASAFVLNAVSAFCLVIVTPVYPWLLREKERLGEMEYRDLHARTGALMLSALLAACIALYGARHIALQLLLGPQIAPAAEPYLLPLLLIAIIGAYKTHFFDQAYHLFSRTRILMALNIVTLLIAGSVIYLGCRLGGVRGLLVALIVANSASMALSAAFACRFTAWRHIARQAACLVLISALSLFVGSKAVLLVPAAALGPVATGLLAAVTGTFAFAACALASNVVDLRPFTSRRS